MNIEEKEPHELAQDRVKAYLARLKQTKHYETIDAFDAGSPDATTLQASDLVLLLEHVQCQDRTIKNLTTPTIEDNSQNWEKSDPAIAFHLIERHAENWADTGKMMTEFAAAKAAPHLAKIAELEILCDATYVAKGADAYNHSCDEMERWQRQRMKEGKDAGTLGSLCDGMSWIQGHVEELEAKLAAATDSTN